MGLFSALRRKRVEEPSPIEWGGPPSGGEQAQQVAEGLGGLGALGGLAGLMSGGSVQIHGDIGSLTDEQKAKLRRLGLDPDALAAAAATGDAPGGVTFHGALAPADAGDEIDDRLARLERLAALHRQGVLTDAELAEQKRRILDG